MTNYYCPECGAIVRAGDEYCRCCGKKFDEKIIDLLKDSIKYLENRISIVDNKVSILIVAFGVFFALIIFILKELYFSHLGKFSIGIIKVNWLVTTINIVLCISFVLFFISLFYLLQTIRPSYRFFWKDLRIDRKIPVHEDNFVMWFDEVNDKKKNEFPCNLNVNSYNENTSKFYISKIKNLNSRQIIENFRKIHYISLQLIRRKYKFYPWSIIFMKLYVLFTLIGLFLVFIFLIFNRL